MECDEFSDDSMLRKLVDYLMGRDEERRTRSKNYAAKQEKNPHRYTRFYRVKYKDSNKGQYDYYGIEEHRGIKGGIGC